MAAGARGCFRRLRAHSRRRRADPQKAFLKNSPRISRPRGELTHWRKPERKKSMTNELVRKDGQWPAEGKPYRSSYLEAISGPEGHFCRFKDGRYILSGDGSEMDTQADYLCLFRETRISW